MCVRSVAIPPVGGLLDSENCSCPLRQKPVQKWFCPIKGGSLCVKDVFAKKFLVPAEIPLAALASVLRKHSTEGRTPDAVGPQIKRKISLHLRAGRTRSVGRLIRRPARSPRPPWSIALSNELLCIHKSSKQTGNLPGGMWQAGNTARQCGSG
jgi:hypothetical protein